MGDEKEYTGLTIEHKAEEVKYKAEIIEDNGRGRGKGERSTERWRVVRGSGRRARRSRYTRNPT